MERKGGKEEGVWEPEAEARTSVPASLAANRPLTLHPFRSREHQLPERLPAGAGPLLTMVSWPRGAGFLWVFPLTLSRPAAAVNAAAARRRGRRSGARASGRGGWRPKDLPRSSDSSALPHLVPLPPVAPVAPGGSRPSFQLLPVDGFLLPRFPSYTHKSLRTPAAAAPTTDRKASAQQKRP